MKISVAMTTYNGEKYLYEQLMSLFMQSRKANEVIICDDRSNDKTVEILEKFIAENRLENIWKVCVNSFNKGYNKNFLDCADMTTGDIIFFCDQDDIWHKEKINKMVSEFEKNENIKAMSCRITTIDEHGNNNNSLFIKSRLGNGKLEKIKFSKQVRDNMSSGLTLAIKRELFDYAKPIILENRLCYDLPMGILASATGNYYILWKPLVYHRLHAENTSTPKYTLKLRLKSIDYHILSCNRRIRNMKSYADILKDKLTLKDNKNLYKAIKILEKELKCLEQRKVFPLFFAVFSINPMINRQRSIFNFVYSVVGDYSEEKNLE